MIWAETELGLLDLSREPQRVTGKANAKLNATSTNNSPLRVLFISW